MEHSLIKVLKALTCYVDLLSPSAQLQKENEFTETQRMLKEAHTASRHAKILLCHINALELDAKAVIEEAMTLRSKDAIAKADAITKDALAAAASMEAALAWSDELTRKVKARLAKAEMMRANYLSPWELFIAVLAILIPTKKVITPNQPPHNVQFVLSLIWPRAESEAMLGDFDEQYAKICSRIGARRAWLWAWGQVFKELRNTFVFGAAKRLGKWLTFGALGKTIWDYMKRKMG